MFHERGWIVKRTALSAGRTALINIHSGESWTYGELYNRIGRWVSFFREKGYVKGERVVVYSPNTIELFAVLFACERMGLIYVPLNWRLSLPELQGLLDDCGPIIVLFHKNFEQSVQLLNVHEVASLSIAEKFECARNIEPLPEVDCSDPWMIIYTGGTTGVPKGVVLSHEAVNWNALNTIASWGLSENDTTINYMPLFHTGGLNALSIPLLMAGGTVAIGHQFNPQEALEATNQYEATISLFVPTMYQMMIQTDYFKASNFPSMDTFLSGGAPCPETIYTAFQRKKIRFKEGYGMTEAGPNNFFIRPDDAAVKVGSVGKSMLFNDSKVLDLDGNACSRGEIGELFLKGPHMFTCYWNKPSETNDALHDGWLRTGDLAKIDEDGDTYIVGRKKDMIITGGENVYPQEVEQCLIAFDGIQEAAVIGKEDDIWGEKVVAFVSLYDENRGNEDMILTHCKKSLASYKIPKEIIIIPELPKTHVGKIDKNELLKWKQNR
ncbi:AMP-binding protein [Sporosarcina oncorhynchi]|uniref:AMP-binding protein n=1 Tax=Sporosarcina oncorhynchi TaxID=3056444 RepID=A0ABZ0L8D2_9BACL|nr:AMP-binding protein [Sporosarcina sp. T2O-4]WOV88385.1 AMP-binding protein [Sporosarcina sp. T2O-4]